MAEDHAEVQETTCACGCGGTGKKKGREGQLVDEEGRINLGLRAAN